MDDTYEPAWKAALGGKLTQPVIAGGKVVVSSVEAHTIYALDERSGEVAWRFLAGGRVNSAPTLWNGRVLFGCNDGKVTSLDLDTGKVVWTFRAAPVERRLVARETLESAWPLNGSVLLLHKGNFLLWNKNNALLLNKAFALLSNNRAFWPVRKNRVCI